MPDQYRMVEALLVQQAESSGLDLPHQDGQGAEALPFSSIYMIGDNPASDVRGARNAGATPLRFVVPGWIHGRAMHQLHVYDACDLRGRAPFDNTFAQHYSNRAGIMLLQMMRPVKASLLHTIASVCNHLLDV